MMSQKSRPLFGTVSEIALEDPSSWEERFFLTLDVDWAPDYVIREVDQMLRSLDVAATWFITHESEAIDELRRHDRYEIGVHPNLCLCSWAGQVPPRRMKSWSMSGELLPKHVRFVAIRSSKHLHSSR